MMTFGRNLYHDPALPPVSGLKRRLAMHDKKTDVYVIALCGYSSAKESGKCQIEIFRSIYLYSGIMKKREMKIVGMASGRAEAFELVRNMAQDCLDQTGSDDLTVFLKNMA